MDKIEELENLCEMVLLNEFGEHKVYYNSGSRYVEKPKQKRWEEDPNKVRVLEDIVTSIDAHAVPAFNAGKFELAFEFCKDCIKKLKYELYDLHSELLGTRLSEDKPNSVIGRQVVYGPFHRLSSICSLYFTRLNDDDIKEFRELFPKFVKTLHENLDLAKEMLGSDSH